MIKSSKGNSGKSGLSKGKRSFAGVSDIKLKPLIPTLRQKKRFVKVKIEANRKFDFREISESLVEEIIFYIGAVDFGKSGIWILRDKFDYESQEIVLKVSVSMKDKLVGVLALVRKLGDCNVKLSVVRVSGTFKGLEKKKV